MGGDLDWDSGPPRLPTVSEHRGAMFGTLRAIQLGGGGTTVCWCQGCFDWSGGGVVTSLFVGEGVQDARSLDDQNSVEMREVYLYNQILI